MKYCKTEYGNTTSVENNMNFVELESSIFHDNFLYFDIIDCYADEIFIKNRVKVKFRAKLASDEYSYIAVVCKVRRKFRESFLNSLKELERKMLICGFTDYSDFCTQYFDENIEK